MTRHTSFTPWLLLGPVLLVFLVLFAAPIFALFATSFEQVDTATFRIVAWPTLVNYAKFLGDPYYLGILLLTLKISTLVTIITLIVGYPVAMYLVRAPARERAVIVFAILSPLLVSLAVRSLGWVLLLAPVKLMYTQTAVTLGLSQILFPYMVLALYSALHGIDGSLPLAAQSLGANPLRTFYRIILPLSAPGAVAGCLIVFAISMSSFVTPAILGGPFVKVVAFLAWQQSVIVVNPGFAAAISMILLFVTTLVIVVYNRTSERHWSAGTPT
jgi:putative spermidine/putrescine transport system permease protein